MGELTVHFLVIKPHTRVADWKADDYPWEDLIDALNAIPEGRRQQNVGVLTRPLTYQCTPVGEELLLSVHQVDVAARQSRARDGIVDVEEFGANEGPTNASHLLPLEGPIFALARERPGGPGHQRVANYIGVMAGHRFEPDFAPVARTDGRTRLREMSSASAITLAVATSGLGQMTSNNSFVKAFEAASESVQCDEISISYRINRKAPARAAWFRKHRPELENFLDGDRASITEAKAGNERLLEQAVTATGYVSNTRGSVPPGDVVFNIREQYRARRDEINESLGLKPPT